MKKTTINFSIELDNQNIPEKITWQAQDMNPEQPETTHAIGVSVWDHKQKNTLRIDLWTNELTVDEMKRFVIESMGGFAQTVLNATGDEFMSSEINLLCDKLVEHVKNENNKKP
jgi:gliding motility-associated protein GldC